MQPYLFKGRTEAFSNAFEGSDWSLGGIATGFYSGLFAYAGWNYLNCMIEEMKNPKRDLPIAIVFSCLVVTAAYTLCNVAYFTTVDLHEILNTPAVAVVRTGWKIFENKSTKGAIIYGEERTITC